METVRQSFAETGVTLLREAPTILTALAVFLIAAAVGHLLAVAAGHLLDRTGRAGGYSRLVRRVVRGLMGGLGLILALQVLGLTAVATSLLATGGFMAVILGFAFKEVGENLLAGLFLAFSRSFEVGDLIESAGLRGVVKAIDLRQTHIRTGDGCDIFIPSAGIFRNPLLNFTRDGLRRTSFEVGIDYGDDPERALVLLREALSRVPGVLAKPASSVEISGLMPNYVELRAHVWVNTFEGGSVVEARTKAMAACRVALQSEGFTFSSDVTTAHAIPPLNVKLDAGTSPS